MSTEAWKDSGKCGECRRQKYCMKLCTAAKKQMANAIRTAIMNPIESMVRLERDAKKHLKNMLSLHNEEADDEAIDAAWKRCLHISQSSVFSLSQVILKLESEVMSGEKTVDEALYSLEARYVVLKMEADT